ncbi:hypothetical protein [Hydrogenimonas sp.]
MNRRVTLFFGGVGALMALLAVETGVLASRPKNFEPARAFVALSGLPDLAIATEARFLRFRSLADVFSPFNEGPELLDYFPSSFTYAPSHVEALVPSRIVERIEE